MRDRSGAGKEPSSLWNRQRKKYHEGRVSCRSEQIIAYYLALHLGNEYSRL